LRRAGEHDRTSAFETSLSTRMPSLFRFLVTVAVLAGVVYGALFALANFVTPTPREMTATVPQDKFLKK
jgi:hypothetical protein